jgi:hypothetical protein
MTEEPEGWHKKLPPYNGDKPYIFNSDDYEITEEDIEKAIKKWDELMPEYKGLLDAEIDDEDDDKDDD